jgi:2'-5' RNA ligase
MRLFAAVTPPAHVLDHLAAAIAAVRDDRSAAGDDGPPLRWSGREQWHITLAFYGELAPERLPALARRLARVAGRTPPLDLALTGGGAFPTAERAHVLWADVRGDLRGLRRLADSAAASGRRLGAPPDRKPYRPHLTLARCRTPTDLSEIVARLASADGGRWHAAELHLIRSHPGPHPEYETLHTWPLTGAQASPQ